MCFTVAEPLRQGLLALGEPCPDEWTAWACHISNECFAKCLQYSQCKYTVLS